MREPFSTTGRSVDWGLFSSADTLLKAVLQERAMGEDVPQEAAEARITEAAVWCAESQGRYCLDQRGGRVRMGNA